MNNEQLELIRQLEEIGEVTFVKKLEDPKGAFANYFSNLDIHGIGSLLNENNYYDEVSKENYLNLIQLQFESLKSKGIHSSKLISGVSFSLSNNFISIFICKKYAILS